MNPVLEPLLQSPRLPFYLVELNEVFARELNLQTLARLASAS